MMDPYLQLQMMQQAGVGQYIPGMGGLMSPQTGSGGVGQLMALSQAYQGSIIPGERMVDASPMASLGLSGPFAPLLNIGGNLAIQASGVMNGIMPMGNAGSYMQARRAREFQAMQQQVSQRIGGADEAAMFRNIRGMAALAGINMNEQQEAAARSLASTVSQAAPYMGLFMPGLMDSLSGETGSIQSLASQMMSANRYRTDPITGQMGYGADANAALVENVFEQMFGEDNIARMQGLRAGDMGQLYSSLAAEGLAGPRGNVRDRTIRAIQEIRREGGAGFQQFTQEAIGAGVSVNDNLQALSNADLAKLREGSNTLSNRLTESDADRISSQLQDYVKSISAIREVFGEGGNPNAPMPMLIGALEGLTSGRMHQFDANRLNTMVRDMQALSQQSGKSIDQLVAMNQSNSGQLQQMLGRPGGAFAPTVTGVGVTTGQAFQQVGGATGFGALSRAEAEAGAQSMMARGLGSQMANALGAVGRIEESGGFADNAAGRDLEAAMAAIRAGKETYVDDNNVERRVPTRENEFRSFIQRGAVDGMSMSDFNMMLGDTFANQESLFNDQDLQRGAFRQQFFEYEREVQQTAAGRLRGNQRIQALAPEKQREAADALSSAAFDAMFDLTPEELADQDTRQRVMSDALMLEAARQNMNLTEGEADRMAEQLYGQSNQVARRRGADSTLALVQTQGRAVSDAQRVAEARADALSGRNEAMSPLGPKGSALQRAITALQRQGDEGADADIPSMLANLFGAPDIDAEGLEPLLQKVADKEERSRQLEAELVGLDRDDVVTTNDDLDIRGDLVLDENGNPERDKTTGNLTNRRVNDGTSKFDAVQQRIREVNTELEEAVWDVKEEGRRQGIIAIEGDFNREDMQRGRHAFQELDARRDTRAARDFIRDEREVTEDDINAAADSALSSDDMRVLAREQREEDLEEFDAITQEDLAADEDDREEWSEEKREMVKAIEEKQEKTNALLSDDKRFEIAKAAIREGRPSEDQLLSDIAGSTGIEDVTLSDLPEEVQVAILRDRMGRADMAATSEEVTERMEQRLDELAGLAEEGSPIRAQLEDAAMSQEDFDAALEKMRTEAEEAGVDPTVAINNRKKLRRDARLSQFNQSRQQVLAEKQMRAAGLIDEETTLTDRDALKEDLKDSAIDEDLRKQLVEGTEEEQREALSEFFDRRTLRQSFTDTEAEADVDEPTTTELRKVREQLSEIDSMADEYLADETAVSARGVDAVEDLRAARDEQQQLANEYFEGDRARLYLSPETMKFSDKRVKELTKEFEEADKAELLKELQSDPVTAELYKDKKASDLKAEDFIKLERMKGVRRIQTANDNYRDAFDRMESGERGDFRGMFDVTEEDRKMADEVLGEGKASDEQIKALKSLQDAAELEGAEFTAEQQKSIANAIAEGKEVDTTGMTDEQKRALETREGLMELSKLDERQISALEDLHRMETKDVEKEAALLGVTKEEYADMLRGEDDGQLNDMLLFGGDEDALREAQAAISGRGGLDDLDSKIAKKKSFIAERTQAGSKHRASHEAELKKLEEQRAKQQEKVNDQIKAAGLDPTKDEDREKYFDLMKKQGSVRRMQKLREDYQEEAKALEGLPEEERQEALDALNKKYEQAEERAREMQELSLGESKDVLAEAIGFDKTEDNKEARKDLDFGTNEANQRMLAENYKQLQGVTAKDLGADDLDKDATELEKLDWITDQYKAAAGDEDKINELAEKAGMSSKDLELMMEETKFLGLSREDVAGMSPEEQAEYQSRKLGLVSKEDIEKDVADSQSQRRKMELFGTLKIEGTVNGKATGKNMTGDETGGKSL